MKDYLPIRRIKIKWNKVKVGDYLRADMKWRRVIKIEPHPLHDYKIRFVYDQHWVDKHKDTLCVIKKFYDKERDEFFDIV